MPSFIVSDLSCSHCGRLFIDPRLLEALDELQQNIKGPIQILSAYRCPTHNRAVGGAPRSYHIRGQAADIRVHGLSTRALYRAALCVPAFRDGGIGVYLRRNFLHVDVRERPYRWGVSRHMANHQ